MVTPRIPAFGLSMQDTNYMTPGCIFWEMGLFRLKNV